MNIKAKDRQIWIDLIRIIAILLVLLCHSVEEGINDLSLCGLSMVGWEDRVFSVAVFTIGRLGVPFFLLISGYLLLDRAYTAKTTILFWKNNWLHLTLCTQFWFILYDIFLMIGQREKISLIHMLADVFFCLRWICLTYGTCL